jgi:20S proteasome alpha/beta subunit
MDLNQGIATYRLGLSLLLAGVDKIGHLIRIDDPGIYRSYDSLSYCCIGMGDRHADSVFAWYKYSSTFPLTEALYIGFEAKKRAEMAGGVGRSTDILLIDESSIKEISPDTIKILEEVYHDRESRSERAGFDERITELKIQMCELESSED